MGRLQGAPMKGVRGSRPAATLADALAALCLVAWVGGHAALGAFAARIAFRDLPRPLASSTMTTVFREFDTVIFVALCVLFAAAMLRWLAVGTERRADQVVLLAIGLLVALGAFEVAWVHPQIEQLFLAGRTLEPEFASLHKLSARCANVELALTCAIFGAQAWSRRA